MTALSRPALFRTAAAGMLLLALAACTSTRPATAPSNATATHTTGSAPMNIRVTLDGRPVHAVLNDSPAARDLAALLPLTVGLEDFHGTERIGYPPRKLITAGAPTPVAAKAGDLAYYAPWGNLALFHKDGPAPSADLLVLGHLDAAPDQLARAEKITIEAAP